jgi:5-hydroxyisourate hydrolase-like protein (transthyretin family)
MYTIESERKNSMKIKITLGMLFLMIFLQLCKKETPAEPVVVLFNLHIEGLVTVDGLPANEVSIVLRDYGSGSVYSELKEVYTDEDGRYSIKYGLQGDTSRFRLYIYAFPPQGSGSSFFDVSITEELQIINFEFHTD